MNELKEKIITFRWLKLVFYFIFVSGVVSFLFTIFFIKNYFITDATISIILMLFSYVSNEICNIKIKKHQEIYKSLKLKNKNREVKIIDFEKIA